MRRVVDIERLAAAVAGGDALDLERKDIGDRSRALERVDVNLDRLELDAAEVADEVLADERWRATGVAPDDGGKRSTLDVSRIVVDHARKNPVAVGHNATRADHQREFKPVQLGVAEIAFVDTKHHHRGAVIVRRRLLWVGIDAGAEIVAVAALHVFAAERPFRFRHVDLLHCDVPKSSTATSDLLDWAPYRHWPHTGARGELLQSLYHEANRQACGRRSSAPLQIAR